MWSLAIELASLLSGIIDPNQPWAFCMLFVFIAWIKLKYFLRFWFFCLKLICVNTNLPFWFENFMSFCHSVTCLYFSILYDFLALIWFLKSSLTCVFWFLVCSSVAALWLIILIFLLSVILIVFRLQFLRVNYFKLFIYIKIIGS